METREIPIKFQCNCPDGKHKCFMKDIIEKGKNEKIDKMYETNINGKRYLLKDKPICLKE